MAVYWRLGSVPELEGLDIAMRDKVWLEAKHRAGEQSWVMWLLVSRWSCVICLWFFIPFRESLKQRVEEVVYRIAPTMISDSAVSLLLATTSLFAVGAAGASVYLLVVRPIRIGKSRRYMREFLAGG